MILSDSTIMGLAQNSRHVSVPSCALRGPVCGCAVPLTAVPHLGWQCSGARQTGTLAFMHGWEGEHGCLHFLSCHLAALLACHSHPS